MCSRSRALIPERSNITAEEVRASDEAEINPVMAQGEEYLEDSFIGTAIVLSGEFWAQAMYTNISCRKVYRVLLVMHSRHRKHNSQTKNLVFSAEKVMK